MTKLHPVPLLLDWLNNRRELEMWEKHLLLEGFLSGEMRAPTCMILCALTGAEHTATHDGMEDLNRRLNRTDSDPMCREMVTSGSETIQ